MSSQNPQRRHTSNPPPGAPDGGVWGSIKYAGDNTNLMCILLCLLGGIFTGCGTCAYLCPMDKKDGYRVGKSVYDSNGRLVGNVGNVDFIMNPHWKPSLIAAGPSESATKNSA